MQRAAALPFVVALSVSVVVAGLQMPATADPVKATPSVVGEELTRPDRVSAQVSARILGRRVEDLSQRDLYTRVYANPDGTWTAESASEPEQVPDQDGGWHEVDTTLIENQGGVTPTYAASDLVLSDGGDHTFASMTVDGQRIFWRWPSVLPTPLLEGNVATYENVIAGGDLVVTATSTGFTHNIVLHHAPSEPLEVTTPIVVGSGDIVENEGTGSLEIRSAHGRTLVAAPRPLMWDSSADDAGEPEVASVPLQVGENSMGTPTVTLAPSEQFLSDPDTEYPVTIDPSYSSSINILGGDTWVQNADYTSSQVTSPELRAGTYDGGGHVARSLMRFDTTKWNGKHILSANLVMRNWYSGSCTGSAVRASRVQEPWDLQNLTWANQPVAGAPYDDYATAKGYTSSCAGGDATWNVTDTVQMWADGTANYGIRVRGVDETSIYTWRKYRSSNYGGSVVPHINYTYNSYPNKAATPSVAPGNTGYSTSLTPTFKGTVSDPDGGTVRAHYEVYRGSTMVWSGYSGWVSSGSTASKTIPTGELTNGYTYTVKVKADDGTDISRYYSGTKTFTVDTSKPTTAVTATGFTNGQWTTQAPASNTFTFNGPSDAKSFVYTLDGVAQPSKTADSNGNATLSWLPKSGAHALKVTATDKAGNTGASATFTFGVGPASFAAPAASARSTGVFPIQVSGPPNATAASLSWRYAGKTTWNPVQGITKAGTPWTGAVANTTDGTASASGGLLWDATTQEDPASTAEPKKDISAPALLELRTCFTYAATPSQVCSTPRQIQLVPSAFGGTFPVTNIGPATLALFSGEMNLTETDAVDTLAGVGRGFSTFESATATTGPFGPGWSTSLMAPGDAEADLVDHRTKDRTLVVVTGDGSSQMFTPVDPDAEILTPPGPVEFRPAGTDDGSRLVLDDTTVTLTRPQASTTVWNQQDSEWVLSQAEAIDNQSAAPDTSFEFSDPGYPTWIAQTEPGMAADCMENRQTPGCRGLQVTYTGQGVDRRVSAVIRVVAEADSTASLTLATYAYNTQGLLVAVCGPDPDAGGSQQPLCAHYTYDTTTVPGRTLLKTLAPPGQEPWRFNYDTTGRLTTVARALDANTNTGTAPATWTVRYDIAPTSAGLPDLSAATAATWGQDRVPTKAFALFDPSDPNTTDLSTADMWFTDADGTTTNTAVHANVTADGSGTGEWLVDTVWYDDYGNTIRSLDGSGRSRALQVDPSDREQAAFDASTLTAYNDDGDEDHDDGDGIRVEDEYSPVHTATLKDGTTGPYRAHTAYTYADEAPDLGGAGKPTLPDDHDAFDLVVEIRHSATEPDIVGEYDPTVVRNDYEPIVAGDGNGWKLGVPTRTKVQLEDGSWSVRTTRYDSEGRQIEVRQPGGAVAADGSGADAHTTVMSYYSPDSPDLDCRIDSVAHPERSLWVGQPCKTGPAAQPTGPPIPNTYNAAYDDDLRAIRVVETSGATRRTTTRSFDAIGRTTSNTVTDGADIRATTYGYDAGTGLPSEQAGDAGTVNTTYDAWGRVWRYVDAFGVTSTMKYTTDGQVASRSDGIGTYTYTYDSVGGEHRRLPNTIDIGLPSEAPDLFTTTYNAAGEQLEVAYPNGMTAHYQYDEVGVRTGLDYVSGAGDPLLSFTAAIDPDGRAVSDSSNASQQNYEFDVLGRLTRVEDTRSGSCITRTYQFSVASNRIASATYGAAEGGQCQNSVTDVVKNNTYDAASRQRNPGYEYDNLGRTSIVPSDGTDTGPLTVSYYANDMVRSLHQSLNTADGGQVISEASYSLDSVGRITAIESRTDASLTGHLQYRYSDDSDLPSSVSASNNGGATWSTTRYISLPQAGIVASSEGDALTYQLANLHGDIVATQVGVGTGIDGYSESDEFGNVVIGQPERYGWLGAHQRSMDTLGGLVLMGARLYNPSTGSFLSPDWLMGGNATPYSYPQDPINQLDLTGLWHWVKSWTRYATRRAARAAAMDMYTTSDLLGFLKHLGMTAPLGGGLISASADMLKSIVDDFRDDILDATNQRRLVWSYTRHRYVWQASKYVLVKWGIEASDRGWWIFRAYRPQYKIRPIWTLGPAY